MSDLYPGAQIHVFMQFLFSNQKPKDSLILNENDD